MSSQSQKTKEAVSESISETDYNRQRLSPQLSDRYYVHLSDLKLFLDLHTNHSYDHVLDYGCGGSPYRDLFKAKRYIRADYVDCGSMDYLIGEDGKLPLANESVDLVISTQVLEHVFSPQKYLAEALRVLRPGGKLILTTHGIWEDHGCPYDFWRWTADGLSRELGQAGFRVTKSYKITTGVRAVMFHFSQIFHHVKDSRRGLFGWSLWLLKRSAFNISQKRHRWMDNYFYEHRLVPSSMPGHGFYLCLGVECTK